VTKGKTEASDQLEIWENNTTALTKHLGSIDVQLIGNHAPKRAEEACEDQFISVEEGVGSN
jgi:hypothetical protein